MAIAVSVIDWRGAVEGSCESTIKVNPISARGFYVHIVFFYYYFVFCKESMEIVVVCNAVR